ncbi:hypothetical protein H310_02566 [Aphanomyces invadans]|uniref:Uncharacterized protein n=1 Tax=Aphanomyces invadans TaxID=157072 RepID=A0A024UIJ4_9STRA|nr:hypothetical protein H310_02566 [Aphanomyces invadans]ETW06271.1 hypothetical protein H310_02566 [Aphanomyces invadans]|eukprot:XP_008864346.1 hypothetical protein H310_02566 [Aphanomyces invadans]
MGQEVVNGRLLNAPALPQPPSFKGSTKAERRAFVREYDKYVDQLNALQSSASRPFLIPMSARMDQFTKRRVTMFDLGKSYRDVTKDEWIAWFKKAYYEEAGDYELLKNRVQASSIFDVKIMDADSRVGRMLDGLMTALQRDNQEGVLHQEGEMVADVMAHSVRPIALQKTLCMDATLMTASVMREMERSNVTVDGDTKPIKIYPYGPSAPMVVACQVQFKCVTLETPCGPLALRGLKVWVDTWPKPGEHLLLLSRSVMERLGLSEDDLLTAAYQKQVEWDVSDAVLMTALTPKMGCCAPHPTFAQSQGTNNPELARREEQVKQMLATKLEQAMDEGLAPVLAEKLGHLLEKNMVFRLEIGHDPPSLRVRLRPDSAPATGLVYQNNRATWAAAPRVAPKKGGELRTTIEKEFPEAEQHEDLHLAERIQAIFVEGAHHRGEAVKRGCSTQHAKRS